MDSYTRDGRTVSIGSHGCRATDADGTVADDVAWSLPLDIIGAMVRGLIIDGWDWVEPW
jgi:hypothetical protein